MLTPLPLEGGVQSLPPAIAVPDANNVDKITMFHFFMRYPRGLEIGKPVQTLILGNTNCHSCRILHNGRAAACARLIDLREIANTFIDNLRRVIKTRLRNICLVARYRIALLPHDY